MSENTAVRKLDFALVLDSTTVVDPEYAALIEVQRVPLYITLGTETRPEPEWTVEEIVAGYDDKPCKTACPSAGDFKKCFEEVFAKGYKDIVCVPMTKGVSGTYQAAKVAAASLEGGLNKHVHLVDAPLANFGVSALLNISIPYLKEAGVTSASYAAKLNELASSSSQIWTLGSLDHLYRGGRLSKLSFAIGTLLRIKPIIGVSPDTGGLDVEKKARTFNDVDAYMVERVREFAEKFKRIYVRFINLGDEDQVANLKRKVLEVVKNLSFSEISEVGPLFTVHLGRNGYGMVVLGDGPIISKMESGTKNWVDIFRLRKQG